MTHHSFDILLPIWAPLQEGDEFLVDEAFLGKDSVFKGAWMEVPDSWFGKTIDELYSGLYSDKEIRLTIRRKLFWETGKAGDLEKDLPVFPDLEIEQEQVD